MVLGPGDPAPDFTLRGVDGELVTLSELRGRPVLVEIKAMWCAACQDVTPLVSDLHEARAHDGLVTLDVLIEDLHGELPDARDAERWREAFALSYPVLRDEDGSFAPVWNPTGQVPLHTVIDREGTIVLRVPAASRAVLRAVEDAVDTCL